jgi:hypothetical protein
LSEILLRLTRGHVQLITAMSAHILPMSRAYNVDKNSERVHAIGPFFSSYGHFLNFRSNAEYYEQHANKEFSHENFSNNRPLGQNYILKVSAQTDVFILR